MDFLWLYKLATVSLHAQVLACLSTLLMLTSNFFDFSYLSLHSPVVCICQNSQGGVHFPVSVKPGRARFLQRNSRVCMETQ